MIFGVQFASILLAAAIVLAGGIVPDRHRHRADTDTSIENVEPLPAVTINDNRRAAGVLDKNTLTLELRAGVGLWRPEGDAGPALRIEAFGERGAPLTVPSALVRVPERTEVVATIHNNLESLMRVFGFCERGTAACAPIEIPARETREVRFKTGPAGSYHYWATTTGMPMMFRAVNDTQLSGAFIVDPAGADPQADRVFVITDWTSLTLAQLKGVASAQDPGVAFLALNPKSTFLMNGLSWPHTERLTARIGQPVRWRILNLSTQTHTMHLHGFYFDVESLGDGVRDHRHAPDQKPHVVTQLMPPGATMAMTWMPERVGNWLFHCHIRAHVSPDLRLAESSIDRGSGHAHVQPDGSAGMAGMVLGVTVLSPGGEPVESSAEPASDVTRVRRMTLEMRPESGGFGGGPAYRFVLAGGKDATTAGKGSVPGPTLVLTRGESVEITLVNRLPEATAIHWHGMELESYYDGVHGWSGAGQRVTPLIEPGGSFVVRFTPPRTGTFMYHTHMHDPRQLTAGLYGAMLVVEPGAAFDDSIDHVFILGRAGPDPGAPALLNGETTPQVRWRAGVRHRVRLINITPSDVFSVTLQTNEGPLTWQPLTKDGAPVPTDRREPAPAKQLIGAGETYDFEIQSPPGHQNLWLEVRSPGGRWEVQGQVVVR
jgi:FtsP/CotA-like multicopper oxidase with cupredoxin domain